MKLFFIDEISESKFLGISLICIDLTKYQHIKTAFLKTLKKKKWNLDSEFKGRYLFARNPAGQDKSPEEMIGLTTEIIKWLSDGKNAKGNVYFGYNNLGYSQENVERIILALLSKVPKAKNAKNGKNLCAVYQDYFEGCAKPENARKLSEALSTALSLRGYTLIESTVTPVHSSNNSVGVIYSDVLAYICKWRINNPSRKECTLIDLIEHTTAEKIGVIHNLLEDIKKIQVLKIE